VVEVVDVRDFRGKIVLVWDGSSSLAEFLKKLPLWISPTEDVHTRG
jgi:hypothetical protein